MKKLKYSREIYKYTRLLLGFCPICKTTIRDKRYNEHRTIESCNIYRTSQTSVTMHCRQCGLYFTVTWRSLAKAIGEKADTMAKDYALALEKGANYDGKDQDFLFLSRAYQVLQESVNIEGTFRNR